MTKKKKKVYCVRCEHQKSGDVFCQPITENDYFAPYHIIDVSMKRQNCYNDCEYFIQKKEKKK